MFAPLPLRIQRRHFCKVGVGALTAGLGGLAALRGCGGSQAETGAVSRYRVSGPSMNPTLWGPSRSVRCEICGVTIRIDEAVLAQANANRTAKTSPPSSVQCWHCGGSIAGERLIAAMQHPPLSPDLVDVTACPPTELDAGDMVLLQHRGLHIKRLLGKPGQTVSLDESNRLLIDGSKPLFAEMPRVPVDDDRFRDSSRWYGAAASSHWQRDSDRTWTASGDAGWLVYEHANVYRGNRPSRVLDDYPGNLGVQRPLLPATGLTLHFKITAPTDQRQTEMHVWAAFWTEGGINLQHQLVPVNSEVSIQAQSQVDPPAASQISNAKELTAISGNSLTPERPIGLRLASTNYATVAVQDLSVTREVLYRIDPSRRPHTYPAENSSPTFPLPLGDDEWFVVGDNVPLSIDSRHWGPIKTHQILGRAAQVE